MILKDGVFIGTLHFLLRLMERKITYVVALEGIYLEHPTSGTSFLEAVAILDVVAVSAATFDVYLKQFLDGMEVVDEGPAGEFRSLAEF